MEQLIIHKLWRIIVIYEKIQYDVKGMPSLDIYIKQNDKIVCVVRITECIVVIFTIVSTQPMAKLFSEGIFCKVRAPLGEMFRCFTHPPCLVFMVSLQHGGCATYKALSGKY